MRFQDFIKRLFSSPQYGVASQKPPSYRAYTSVFDRVISGEDAATWEPGLPSRSLPDVVSEGQPLECLVTVLIDHSGSLRGHPIRSVIQATETLGDRLEELRLPYEVLAYTTSSWRGGEAFKKWVADGSPVNPGRVCDLLHVVYRDASTPDAEWRKNLRDALRHRQILKENVDGEALRWARDRAEGQSAKKWILLVISDGVPVDDGTLKANRGGGYNEYEVLRGHLREVLDDFGSDQSIVAGALGIGWDVDTYYDISRVALTDNQASEFASALLDELLERSGIFETAE